MSEQGEAASPRPALPYDAGAEHRVPLDGYTLAVIAVRFVAITQLMGISWYLYTAASLFVGSGAAVDSEYLAGTTLQLGFNVASAVVLWLFAEPIARRILPRAAGGAVATLNVQYAAIGIALVGLFIALDGVPYLLHSLGGYVEDLWKWWNEPPPPPPATGLAAAFSSTTISTTVTTTVWSDSHQRVITLGVAVSQLLVGLAVILLSRRLARWRPFRG